MSIKDGVYLKIYDRIVGWIPEDDIILPEDKFECIGVDSLDVAELIMWSEEEFNLEINESELWAAKIETVGAFAQFIESQLKKEV